MSTPDTRTGEAAAAADRDGTADQNGIQAGSGADAGFAPTSPPSRPRPARKASSLAGWGAPRSRSAKPAPTPAPAPPPDRDEESSAGRAGTTTPVPLAKPVAPEPEASVHAASGTAPSAPVAPVGSAVPPLAAASAGRPAAPSPAGATSTQKLSTARPAAPPPVHQSGRPRRARLVVARVDPWSVMKLAFLLSIAVAVVTVVAVVVLWSVLDGIGAFDAAADSIQDITETEGDPGFQLMDYAGLSRVVGVTTVLACVNIVLLTAIATLGAFLYNLSSSLVGGLHVTLTESD